jgi:uncharacterized DUF497 family protein
VKFEWDTQKNEQIKKERGISFEEIVILLGSNQIWRISKHWNSEKYPRQRVFLVPVEGYIHVIPFVEDDGVIFLKTIFPSRKLTKMYLEEMEAKNERK